MACCILTAFVMNRIIKICDAFDIRFFEIKYSDAEYSCAPAESARKLASETCRISIGGMTCGACVAAVTKELDNVVGVLRANVSLPLGRASVSYDPALTTPERFVKAIGNAGYEATLGERSLDEIMERLRQSSELQSLRAAISSASVCSTLILGLEHVPILSKKLFLVSVQPGMVSWLLLLMAFRVQAWDARTIHARAWSVQNKSAVTMDTLLSLSLILGLGLSILQTFSGSSMISSQPYASSGSFLTVVILAGRYLEAVLRREGNAHLTALYEMQTEKENYQIFGTDVVVPASLLKKGDDVIILPQATVPCDCYIVEGSSAIDESTITGEASPVTKEMGDFLLAGTKNLSRRLRVTICQDQSESSLAKVIEGVSTATEQRLEGTESLDVVMRVFVSGVMLLALVAFATTLNRHWGQPVLDVITAACERAMTVLAAACPCGIGLATPSAAMAGVDAAYSEGVLLSGGIRTMDALSKATHVVMDKTGTLTKGKLKVMSHHFDGELTLNKDMCYRLLAAAEAEDARVHPVAKAVFKWALAKSTPSETMPIPEHVKKTRHLISTPGRGTSCEVQAFANIWTKVSIGTTAYLHENGIEVATDSTEDSKVHFAFDGRYGGYLCVQDTIRPEAPSVIQSLLSDGLQVSMLTGDAAPEAACISSLLNIPVLASRASPFDKQRYVQDLQRQGHRVVMVGDGVNDLLAQATADVGVSISLTQGCLASTGSVVILSGNLHCLADAFSISRQVVAQARMNVRWALVYNIVALSLALGVFEGWGIAITP
jgi:Cu+-exporting ATPase